MAEVLRWVDLREDREVAKLLEDSGVDGAVTAWEASQSRTDKARDSVYGTAEDLLAIYADERVQRFTAGHDLAEQDFLAGDHTLYLYAPVHEQRRLRPLFETVAMQLVQTAQEQAARAPDGMLDPRLLCALDEAGNVAALELLPEWATTGRGQGIQLLSVWHDQAQLVHRYGDRAATILNGHRAKVFLSGLADVGALELGSRLIGDQAVTETNYSTDPTGPRRRLQATSYRPLVPVEELRRLQPGEGIVIYGHLRPARIQVRPHFTGREQRWRQRLARRVARQQERQARKGDRVLERAARREARRQQRVNRHLPGWAQGREGPAVSADPTPTTPSVSTFTSASTTQRHPLGTVYLFHFDQRYEHAGHYTGWAEDLDHRVAEHLAGRGARLIEVITQAGIGFRLARTWPGVTRARERQLKRQGGASRHCPICQEDRKARGLPRRPTRDQSAGSNQQSPTPWAAAVPARGTRPDPSGHRLWSMGGRRSRHR
jgi:predicted GIY-YIG superfamily endonuclease